MKKKTVIFALTSSVGLANEIAARLGIPLGLCDVKHFADGEIMVELGESVRGKNVYIVQSTCNPVSSNLMEILIAIDACKRASAEHIAVVMPYFGYARQDRKAKPRQPITSKLVAGLLEKPEPIALSLWSFMRHKFKVSLIFLRMTSPQSALSAAISKN